MMETEALDLLEENGKVVGVRAKNKDGEFDIRAELVVGADGRHSTIREKAKFEIEDLGAPIDVLWFRIPRSDDGTKQSLGYAGAGKAFVMLDRDSYWQCAYIIKKGGYEEIKAKGLEALKESIVKLNPTLAKSVEELDSWDQVKFLSVSVDHLKCWYKDGLICIGDSAHAMSPLGGVGINVAIHDAIAAGNILVPVFKKGTPSLADLAHIEARRSKPARKMQNVQVFLHNRMLKPILTATGELKTPLILRVIQLFPYLRRFPSRIIGLGFNPEHIEVDLDHMRSS
jgi:2-polyprenyl-6-methoxyphenol hydroxylase-like FAD-dependent oxidoreductase